jgi:hypothetical protein
MCVNPYRKADNLDELRQMVKKWHRRAEWEAALLGMWCFVGGLLVGWWAGRL